MLNLTTQEMLAAVFVLILIIMILGTIFRRVLKLVLSIGLIVITFFISTCWLPGKITQLMKGDIDTTQIVEELNEKYNETGLPNPIESIKESTDGEIDWSLDGWKDSYSSLYDKIQENPSYIIEGNR